MTKLLHKFATKHMPHIAAKMTPEKGYRAEAHKTASDLVKAGVITEAEGKNFEDCITSEADSDNEVAAMLKAVADGHGDSSKHNDQDFVDGLFGSDEDLGGEDLRDDQADADESIEA
jgi:hypothetical protein